MGIRRCFLMVAWLAACGDDGGGHQRADAGPDQSADAAPAGCRIAAESGDFHMCDLTAGGEARCWGGNMYGAVGDQTTEDQPSPHPVALDQVTAISAGGWHTCALGGGQAHCWGGNEHGQLGDGGNQDSGVPVPVSLDDVLEIEAGGQHSCARLAGGVARCWG